MNLAAKKSLGQHFLVNDEARRRIAEAADIKEGDIVIEIGPGTGLLTRELLALPAKKVIAFEVDDRAVGLLSAEISDERFEVRNEDFLKVDMLKLREEFGAKLKVVGNIPYYITSPIIFKVVDEREHITDATLLIQLEVAERLAAKPRTKEYGIPSVLVNFFGEVTFRFKVPAGAFRPVPNVDSALVTLDLERDYFTRIGESIQPHFETKTFQSFVRTMFAMRRKMLRNNLKSFLTAGQLAQAVSDPAIIPFLTRRAEELDIKNFLSFFDSVQAIRHE